MLGRNFENGAFKAAAPAALSEGLGCEDSDDEDRPLVFTRRKTNQISSELKNSSLLGRPDKPSGKLGSDARTLNDRSSSALKGKMVSSSNLSSSKPTPGTQKSPSPSSKPLKSPSSSTRPSLSSPSSTRPSPSPQPSSNRPSPSPQPSSNRPSPAPQPSSNRPSPSPQPSSTRPSQSPQPSSNRPSPSPPSSTRPSQSPQPSSNRPSPSPLPSRAPHIKSPSINGASSANHQLKKDILVKGEKRFPVAVKEEKRAPAVVKEEKPVKPLCDDSDDSDDDMPLSARCSVVSQKGISKVTEAKPYISDSEDEKPLSARMDKGRATAGASETQKLKARSVKQPDDSDDENTLLTKLQMKGNSGASTSKHDDYGEDKLLASKLQQNGSIKKETQTKKGPFSSVKRPPSADLSDRHSSIKKVKLSDASTSGKAYQIPPKARVKDDDDHIPIGQRLNKSASGSKSVPVKKVTKVDSSKLKRVNKKSKKIMKKSSYSKSSKELPNSGDGQKWTTLVHSGVIFPPPYQPHGVKMLYNGKPVSLMPEQEEVATMYAMMLETDYVKKEKFNENFFSDWKKLLGKNHVIQDLSKCDFRPMLEWYLSEKEKKKQMTTEEKKALKEEKLKLEEKYMWAIVDGVKEKVGNFRVEPPGLFRGRGEHPKMGKLKKRIYPSDITINIGKDTPIPECPIPGQSWKEVRHDNTVTWLAYWNDPINPKEFKYVFLAASSTLKGQSDKEKYEKARKLKDYIEGIRTTYKKNFKSSDMTRKQIAVATYLIDRLALRAGNEKDDDEADTVGCCTLKVENVIPKEEHILEFDFLGKDSIKYYKQFAADKDVYAAVKLFRQGKRDSDDLFDKLDTSKLNAHLKELMPGLTAKVFRTFNASITLDDMLATGVGIGEVPEKIASYQHANKEVAIICNHQRTVSKSHSAQMDRLKTKIDEAKAELIELESDMTRAKKGKPPLKDSNGKQKRNLTPEAIEKKILSAKTKIDKYERDMKSKEDLKEIALGTSKINYLDPRITVAWCKRNEVPIEKIFNKSLLAKFSWAMDCDPSFRF